MSTDERLLGGGNGLSQLVDDFEDTQEPDARGASDSGLPTETKPYDFAQDKFLIVININPTGRPYYTTHHLRRPTFAEEEARERLMPYDTEQAGRMEGRDAFRADFEEEPGNVALYDRIVTGLEGYGFDDTVRRFKGQPKGRDDAAVKAKEYDDEHQPNVRLGLIDPNEIIEITPKRGPQKGQQLLVPFKAAVPGWNKNRVIDGLFNATFEMDTGGMEVFSLGAGREWRVRQEIGGGVNPEDGSIRPPAYVITYTFAEPTEAQRRTLRSKAVNAVSWAGKGGKQKGRSTANLSQIDKLFNELIVSIEGATVDGAEFDADKLEHKKAIFGNFKKLSITKLFRALEADLGNSESA